MEKLLEFIERLKRIKFSGSVVVTFRNGGIRSFKANSKDNS
jgi:hypothetical protein